MTVETAGTTLDSRLENVQRAGGFAPEVIQAFAAFLREAAEDDLFRMSPLRYAERAGIAARQAIDLFLYATRAGVLEFNWGVLCPICAGFLTTPEGLRSLSDQRGCGLCGITVEATPDDNVEVAFTVAPMIRKIRFHVPDASDSIADGFRRFFSTSVVIPEAVRSMLEQMYCWGQRLAPASSTSVPATLEAGNYMVLAPAMHVATHLEVKPDGDAEVTLDLVGDRFIPARAVVRPGARLTVRNLTQHRVTVNLYHRPATPPPPPVLRPYLTGKQLVTTQVFRELFQSESIPSEGGLQFKALTFLFTDLKGSTEMYDRIGDFRAYGLVREHFSLLRNVVATHDGAIVKTIGDAIMASFAEPLPALRAAIRMNEEIRRLQHDEDMLLKIGLHTGPCIAVESNDRLDYFGQTVNIAARVQGIAGANEIVCTDVVYEHPGAAPMVAAARLTPERAEASLKGVGGPVTVYRLA